jgi:hypothetical protein
MERRRVGGAMSGHKCFSLLLGARNTKGARRTFSGGDEALIREITFRHFPDGFTILNAEGGWFDPVRRKFIEEHTRQILVHTSNRTPLRAWCAELAEALNQRELLVVEVGPARAYRFPRTATSGKHR